MTLRHIRIFLEVCEQDCHVTRAAEALHMTQPAVTLAIREMEGYYGVKLFERIGRRLRITEAGVRLRQRRRPGGRPAGPGMHRAGPGEKYVRHRLLHAHEYRQQIRAQRQRSGHERCVVGQW